NAADLAGCAVLTLVAEPDQVFGEISLSLNTAVALLGEHRLEPVGAHPVHDLGRGNVGVTVTPARVLVGRENRRRDAAQFVVGEDVTAKEARGAGRDERHDQTFLFFEGAPCLASEKEYALSYASVIEKTATITYIICYKTMSC